MANLNLTCVGKLLTTVNTGVIGSLIAVNSFTSGDRYSEQNLTQGGCTIKAGTKLVADISSVFVQQHESVIDLRFYDADQNDSINKASEKCDAQTKYTMVTVVGAIP